MQKKIFLIFLISISMFLNIFIRLDTLFLNKLKEKAKKEVYWELKENLKKEINTNYPEMSNKEKGLFLKSLFFSYLKDNKKIVKKEILEKFNEARVYYQDENGFTYLLEEDPYRWYRRIKNFLSFNCFGTRKVNNQDYDDLMYAPLGKPVEPIKLHFYLGFYWHKFLGYFNNRLTLMNTLCFFPVFFSIFLVIIVFIFSKEIGLSYLGSFIASLALGLSRVMLFRSSFGWFDTDLYNVFFPLLILSFLGFAFKKENYLRYFFIVLASLAIGIYSSLWRFWWISFYVTLLIVLVYKLGIIIYSKEKLGNKLKNTFLDLFTIFISSYLFIFLISGFESCKMSIIFPFIMMSLRNNLVLNGIWPNLLLTVNELERVAFSRIIEYLGGWFIFIGGILGIVFLVFKKRKILEEKEKYFLILALFGWLLIFLILTNFGVRFVLFLVIPIGIGFGAFFYMIENVFSYIFKKKLIKVLLVFICSLPLIESTKSTIGMGINLPMMNDTWHNMLNKIKEITPKDAIINAYWDYGDLIMAIGERATIYDGSSRSAFVGYWFPKFLLSKDQKEAIGILRMLNTGSEKTFEKILELTGNDKFLAVKLIKELILLEKEEAKEFLKKYTENQNKIDEILSLFFDIRRPVYLLLENRMLRIMGSISFLGNWDFERFEIWQKFNKFKEKDFINYLKDKFDYSEKGVKSLYKTLNFIKRNEDIFDWLTFRYGFYPNRYIYGKKEEETLLFENGLIVDLKNLDAHFRDDLNKKWIKIDRIIFYDGKTIKENIKSNNNNNNLSVFIRKDNDSYKAILFDTPLADTVFFKLYFLDAKNLKNFKKVFEVYNEKFGDELYLYRVEF